MTRELVSIEGDLQNPAEAPLLALHPTRPVAALVVAEGGDPHAFVVSFFAVSGGPDQGGGWLDLKLRHDFMREPACVAWSPLAEVVAVGCRHGVCLWRLLPDGTAWMTFLQHPRLRPVTGLTWSPTGRHVASMSPDEASFLVWDTALRTSTTIKSPRPLSHLAWSPSSLHLLATLEGGMFSVWETSRWTAETFSFRGQAKAVAWAPDGARVAVAVDHVEAGDRVWAVPRGGGPGEWVPATVLAAAEGGPRPQVRVAMETADPVSGVPGEEMADVPRHRCHADKPIVVATVHAREDTCSFSVTFELAFLPPFDDSFAAASAGAPKLPTSCLSGLTWAPDGASLLASYFVPTSTGLSGRSAVAAFSVRHEPLSFAPLHLLDLRSAPASARGAAFWQGRCIRSRLLVAAAWGESRDLIADAGEGTGPGLAIYAL
jgi:hypothetical protein